MLKRLDFLYITTHLLYTRLSVEECHRFLGWANIYARVLVKHHIACAHIGETVLCFLSPRPSIYLVGNFKKKFDFWLTLNNHSQTRVYTRTYMYSNVGLHTHLDMFTCSPCRPTEDACCVCVSV